MVNITLATTIKCKKMHKTIWTSFLQQKIECINFTKLSMIFVLCEVHKIFLLQKKNHHKIENYAIALKEL